MGQTYYPEILDALFETFDGVELTDPGSTAIAAHDPVFCSALFVLKPWQDEIMGLIAKHLENGGTWRIYNGTGGALTKGTLLYVSGIQGPVESGDSAAQLASWVIHGLTVYNSKFGLLYWELTNSGTTRTVKLYKSIHKQSGDEVASGSRVGDGSITLTASNSSGITGTVTVTYTTDDTDTANTLAVNCLSVAKADANDPAKLACMVVKADLSNATAGIGYGRATVTGLDTSAVSADGVKVYLDQSVTGTAGGYVETKPAGDYVHQVVGTVEIDHATNGSIHFYPGARKIEQVSAAMLGGTTVTYAGSVPKWYKLTVSESAFTAGAASESVTLFSLPARGVIHGFYMKHSTAFSGGGIADYTLEIGISGDTVKYMTAFDVFQAVADTAAARSGPATALELEAHTAATNILLTARCASGNVSAATAGSVDIWVLVSKLP